MPSAKSRSQGGFFFFFLGAGICEPSEIMWKILSTCAFQEREFLASVSFQAMIIAFIIFPNWVIW